MCNQQYFCFGAIDILESGYIIAILSFIMDSICAFFDFYTVITAMYDRTPMSTGMATFYIVALTVYVGAAIQNLMLCCAGWCDDLTKFFDTYNGVSFLFCIFAFFDGIFYRERTNLMIFFFISAALNIYFLTLTCSLKKEMKRDRQLAIQEGRTQTVFQELSASTSTDVRSCDTEMPKFIMALNVQQANVVIQNERN